MAQVAKNWVALVEPTDQMITPLRIHQKNHASPWNGSETPILPDSSAISQAKNEQLVTSHFPHSAYFRVNIYMEKHI